MKINYNDKRWLNKRQQVLRRDNFKCRGCGTKNELRCHHSYYISGRELWEYPLVSFFTLCEGCHSEFHEKIKGFELVIRDLVKLEEKIKEEISIGFVLKNRNSKKLNIVKTTNKKHKLKKVKLTEEEKALKIKEFFSEFPSVENKFKNRCNVLISNNLMHIIK